RVGEPLQPGELADVTERDRGEAGGLDGLEVPAAALHVEHVHFLAEEVLLSKLDRGVASAVQHERAVAAQQARGVDALAERPGELRRFRVAPEAFHGAIILFATGAHRPSNRAPAV